MSSKSDLPPTLSLFGHLMEPIVSLLIRSGITHRAFTKLCKQIFVEVAAREYGIHGRDTNDTRIAMLTGIDRREVNRLKNQIAGEKPEQLGLQNQNRVTRLLSGWHMDPDFLDADGKPIALQQKGSHPSFETLANRYGGDVTVSALLSEMIRGQVVVKNSDNTLQALQRYYIPSRHDLDALIRASAVIRDFSDLLVHNLYIAEPEKDIPFKFERTAINTRIDPEMLPDFHDFLDREGQAFLESVDQWLTDHEHTDDDQENTLSLGVGVYFIDKDDKRIGETGDEE